MDPESAESAFTFLVDPSLALSIHLRLDLKSGRFLEVISLKFRKNS
jgi:hypothetical protein